MFCSNCGKQIGDNEVCSCQNVSAASEAQPIQEKSVLPSASQVIASASQAAANVGKNPIINECFKMIKGVMSKNTIKTVGLAASRKDILWVILFLVEAVVNAFIATFSLRHSIYFYVKDIANSLTSIFGTKFKFSDMAEGFKALEMGAFKIFGIALLINLITFFVFAGLLFVLMMILKKKATFSNVANMIAVAFLPATIITIPSFLCSLIAPSAICAFVLVAFLTTIPLLYLGMQKIDKFQTSPFWAFIIFYAVAMLISFGIGAAIISGAFEQISSVFEGLSSELLNGLF